MPSTTSGAATRGRLVSIEGLNGVGKTYLTNRVLNAATHCGARAPQVIEEFSRRTDTADLGRLLLRPLATASDGEYFLRGGFPRSETLLLLAIKMHDFESTLPALLAGDTVIEGRSIHSVAVYQSLIMESDDDAALTLANQILTDTARWRPPPDLTIVLTDNADAAIRRAETRDGKPFTDEQRHLLHRVASLFERLAILDPERVRLLDRREHDTDALVDIITTWIADAPARPFHSLVPAATLP